MSFLYIIVYLIVGLIVALIVAQILKYALGEFFPTLNPKAYTLLLALIGLVYLIFAFNLLLPYAGFKGGPYITH